MALTPDDIAAVRRTWAMAAAVADQTGKVFYANLFRVDPSTRPLFVGDLDRQGRKLTQTLGFIVDHLEDTDTLLPAARELAIRHLSYGVTADQYAAVGAALIATLKQLLGPAFGAEEEHAWTSVYSTLSDAMIAAAYPV